MEENPGQGEAAGQRPLSRRVPLSDDAAAGPRGAAEAARGARVPLHRRPPDPARRPRAPHRRLHGRARFPGSRPRPADAPRRVTAGLALAVCLLGAWLLADAAATVSPGRRQAPQAPATPAPLPLTLPNKPDSLKFGVLGDFGTGKREQYQLGEQMAKRPRAVPVRAGASPSATTSTAANGRRTSQRSSRSPTRRCSTAA